MRRVLALLIVVAAETGCDASLANRASVYPPVTGKFNVKWSVDVPGASLVIVQLDGAEVGRAATADSGFQVQLDSRRFANGLHRLHLEAHSSAGTTIEALDHTILISN